MRSKYLNITVQTMDVCLSEITAKDCPYIASKSDKEITNEELGNAVDVIIAYLYQQNKDGLLVDIHGRDDYLAENDRWKEKKINMLRKDKCDEKNI